MYPGRSMEHFLLMSLLDCPYRMRCMMHGRAENAHWIMKLIKNCYRSWWTIIEQTELKLAFFDDFTQSSHSKIIKTYGWFTFPIEHFFSASTSLLVLEVILIAFHLPNCRLDSSTSFACLDTLRRPSLISHRFIGLTCATHKLISCWW